MKRVPVQVSGWEGQRKKQKRESLASNIPRLVNSRIEGDGCVVTAGQRENNTSANGVEQISLKSWPQVY